MTERAKLLKEKNSFNEFDHQDAPSMERLENDFTATVHLKSRDLRSAWDSRAEEWDRKYRCEERTEHEPRILDVAARLRKRGVLTPGCDVADIGCGPGRFVAEFAKTARSVLGVDISPKMTHYGERFCAELGIANARFRAENFASADIAALGWENRFDLAFSSITPAVATLQGLENFMRISRGWCFNVSFIYRDNPIYADILKTLFGKEPNDKMTSHSHWFYELFNLLWFRGYFPETYYYNQHKTVHLSPDAETAERLTRYLLEEEEVTEDAVNRVRDYLERHAGSGGYVIEESDCRFGWLLWNVNDRKKRDEKWRNVDEKY